MFNIPHKGRHHDRERGGGAKGPDHSSLLPTAAQAPDPTLSDLTVPADQKGGQPSPTSFQDLINPRRLLASYLRTRIERFEDLMTLQRGLEHNPSSKEDRIRFQDELQKRDKPNVSIVIIEDRDPSALFQGRTPELGELPPVAVSIRGPGSKLTRLVKESLLFSSQDQEKRNENLARAYGYADAMLYVQEAKPGSFPKLVVNILGKTSYWLLGALKEGETTESAQKSLATFALARIWYVPKHWNRLKSQELWADLSRAGVQALEKEVLGAPSAFLDTIDESVSGYQGQKQYSWGMKSITFARRVEETVLRLKRSQITSQTVLDDSARKSIEILAAAALAHDMPLANLKYLKSTKLTGQVCRLIEAYHELATPYKLAPPQNTQLPNSMVVNLIDGFVVSLNQIARARGVNPGDLLLLHCAVTLQNMSWITSKRDGSALKDLCSQVLLREGVLAERLNQTSLYGEMMNVAVRAFDPNKYLEYQADFRRDTGMNYTQRLELQPQLEQQIAKDLRAKLFKIEHKNNASLSEQDFNKEFDINFEITGRLKRLFSVLLKILDPREEKKVARDYFGIRIVFKGPNAKSNLEKFRREKLWQAVEGAEKREESRLLFFQDEVAQYDKIEFPNPHNPNQKLAFELQLMTEDFRATLYGRGLFAPIAEGLAHWAMKATRNFRILALKHWRIGLRDETEACTEQMFPWPDPKLSGDLDSDLRTLAHYLERKFVFVNAHPGALDRKVGNLAGLQAANLALSPRRFPKGATYLDLMYDSEVDLDPQKYEPVRVQFLSPTSHDRPFEVREIDRPALDAKLSNNDTVLFVRRLYITDSVDIDATSRYLNCVQTTRAKLKLLEEAMPPLDDAKVRAAGMEYLKKTLYQLNIDEHIKELLSYFPIGLVNEKELLYAAYFDSRGELAIPALLPKPILDAWYKETFVWVKPKVSKIPNSTTLQVSFKLDQPIIGAMAGLIELADSHGLTIRAAHSRQTPDEKGEIVEMIVSQVPRPQVESFVSSIRTLHLPRKSGQPVRLGHQRDLTVSLPVESLGPLCSYLSHLKVNIETLNFAPIIDNVREPVELPMVHFRLSGPTSYDDADSEQKAKDFEAALIDALERAKSTYPDPASFDGPKGTNIPIRIEDYALSSAILSKT